MPGAPRKKQARGRGLAATAGLQSLRGGFNRLLTHTRPQSPRTTTRRPSALPPHHHACARALTGVVNDIVDTAAGDGFSAAGGFGVGVRLGDEVYNLGFQQAMALFVGVGGTSSSSFFGPLAASAIANGPLSFSYGNSLINGGAPIIVSPFGLGAFPVLPGAGDGPDLGSLLDGDTTGISPSPLPVDLTDTLSGIPGFNLVGGRRLMLSAAAA